MHSALINPSIETFNSENSNEVCNDSLSAEDDAFCDYLENLSNVSAVIDVDDAAETCASAPSGTEASTLSHNRKKRTNANGSAFLVRDHHINGRAVKLQAVDSM